MKFTSQGWHSGGSLRRLALTLLTTSALSAGLTQAGSAAEIPYVWSGFYVGGHVGYAWSDKSWSGLDPNCIPGIGTIGCASELGSHLASGVLGGGQIGVNWQKDILVYGIEAQFSFAGLKGSHSQASNLTSADGFSTFTGTNNFSTSVRDIGTIAARFGIAPASMDRTLFYVKGGLGFADDRFSLTTLGVCTSTRSCVSFPSGTSSGTFDGDQWRWGWMAGIGIEYALSMNWSVKGEFDYLGLGNKNVTLQGIICNPGCFPALHTVSIDQNIQLFKIGINYHFGGIP
jgi:outer membrane immunogenic protein